MSILFLIFNSAVGFFLTEQHSSSSSAAQHTSPRKKKREQQQHGEWKESKSWKLKLYCWIMKNSTWNHNKRLWKLSRVSFVSQLKSVFFSDLLKCASLAGHWAHNGERAGTWRMPVEQWTCFVAIFVASEEENLVFSTEIINLKFLADFSTFSGAMPMGSRRRRSVWVPTLSIVAACFPD